MGYGKHTTVSLVILVNWSAASCVAVLQIMSQDEEKEGTAEAMMVVTVIALMVVVVAVVAVVTAAEAAE